MSKKIGVIVALYFFLSVASAARDNPFKPVISSSTLGKATNISNGLKPLILQKLNLPTSVRVLKSIKLEVINVDGSKSELKYDINKKVDWHRGIFVSNSKIEVAKKIKKPKPDLLQPFKFLSILVDGKRVILKTKDKMLRELYFSKPYKIAIDFEREVSFYTKTIKKIKPPFKRIVIGNHSKFYRIVFRLDGKYRYKISKIDSGYLVELFWYSIIFLISIIEKITSNMLASINA